MSVSMLSNISYKGQLPDNVRSQFDTIADMVAFSENYLPDIYVTLVVETGKQYIYQRSNIEDPVLGKWRELGGGSGDLSNFYTKTETDTKIQTVKDIADTNTTNIGTMTNLTVTSWTDLVTAINSLYNSFMTSLVYTTVVTEGVTKKVLRITYRNGGTVDVDISAIITDAKIGEFADVDTDGITDGQVLGYDNSSAKFIPKSIDLAGTLQSAKDYTDEEIVKAQESTAKSCDAKPTYDSSTDTVTYIQSGETKTEVDTTSWFYYKNSEGNTIQTRWINGVEFTIDVGAINLDDYLKDSDVTSTFEENPTDLTKIPNLGYMSGLRTVLISAIGSKVSTSSIVDNLTSTATDVPLSANQGKVLDEKITELTTTVDGKLSIQQTVEDSGKVVSVNSEGKLVLKEGSGTAESVSYSNTSYSDWTTVKKAIDGILAKVDYVKPEITSFTMSADTVKEVGSSIDSITFNWTLNKDVTTQSLTDCTIEASDRTATYSTALTNTKSFTLTVSDGQNTATKSLSVSFRNKVYYGSAAIPDEFNSAFILGLSKNQFATARTGNYAINIGSGEYGFLCYPTSFGTPKCYIGGFETELTSCGSINFTNASGGTSSYSIYRTGRSGLGSITMEIK